MRSDFRPPGRHRDPCFGPSLRGLLDGDVPVSCFPHLFGLAEASVIDRALWTDEELADAAVRERLLSASILSGGRRSRLRHDVRRALAVGCRLTAEVYEDAVLAAELVARLPTDLRRRVEADRDERLRGERR